MVIMEIDFKSLKDKTVYSVISPIQKETKNVRKQKERGSELQT